MMICLTGNADFHGYVDSLSRLHLICIAYVVLILSRYRLLVSVTGSTVISLALLSFKSYVLYKNFK